MMRRGGAAGIWMALIGGVVAFVASQAGAGAVATAGMGLFILGILTAFVTAFRRSRRGGTTILRALGDSFRLAFRAVFELAP